MKIHHSIVLAIALLTQHAACTVGDNAADDMTLEATEQSSLETQKLSFHQVSDDQEAVAACVDECGGIYGRHGRSTEEFCLCAADDAGETCYSGDDCEGLCLYLGVEDVAEANLGRPFGECSPMLLEFGCFSTIPNGQIELVELPYEAPLICID